LKHPFNKDVKEYNYADKRHRLYIDSFQFSKTDDWTNFIPTNSSSLTYQGIVRLNDSIRTYVYCILGAQAETRSAIMGSFGTELDAQKEFLKLLDDSINQHVDTHVKLDYIIAPGLYIIGSDMILKVGTIENYNNNILIATENMKPGKNNINNKKNIPQPLMKGSKLKVYKLKIKHESLILKSSTKIKDEIQPEIKNISKIEEHENMKYILFAVTGSLVGLVIYFSN
jgi:hypothetical protein